MRSALTDLLYRKALTLSPAGVNIGQIITILANNIDGVADAATNFHFLWSGCLEIVAILVMTVYLAGWASAAAPFIVVVVFVMPIQLYLGLPGQRDVRLVRARRRRPPPADDRDPDGDQARQVLRLGAHRPATRRPRARARSRGRLAADQGARRQLRVRVRRPGPGDALLPLVMQLTGQKLDAIIAFTLVSIFNTLRYPRC